MPTTTHEPGNDGPPENQVVLKVPLGGCAQRIEDSWEALAIRGGGDPREAWVEPRPRLRSGRGLARIGAVLLRLCLDGAVKPLHRLAEL